MRQYLEAKQQVPDALLMIRMGDFYEMFFDDAVEAAQLLDITLTSRDKGSENPIPMCGVPHHALKTYVGKLLELGHKVAICEQMEDPALAKGIVRREITQVVSPGVVFDPDSLEATENNYLGAVVQTLSGLAFAYADVSTGECRACHTKDLAQLRIELARVDPRELICSERSLELTEKLGKSLPRTYVHTASSEWFDPAFTGQDTRLSLPEESMDPATGLPMVLGALLGYLQSLRRDGNCALSPPEIYSIQEYMILDETAVTDLEFFRTLSSGQKKGSLLTVLDHTRTPMGARLLRRHLAYPLVDVDTIHRRLDAVEELTLNSVLREEIRKVLKALQDMERLATRTVSLQASPRDLLALARSMEGQTVLQDLLQAVRSPLLVQLRSRLLSPAPAPLKEAVFHLQDPAPVLCKEGGIFQDGYHPELDELRALTTGGKQWLLKYEEDLKGRFGIPSLKIRYNRVFGYYIEVTRANLHLVPDEFIRKQTLVNAERYFTVELKEYEDKVLHAQDRHNALEEELFRGLLDRCAGYRDAILACAEAVAHLDVLTCLAHVAHENDYVRPDVDFGDSIELLDSRHPVVEQMLPAGKFIPNDIRMDDESRQILIITGPNMAGKSTIMRTVALIVAMAQMGSFVPARKARIGLVDRIFTRVGATDSLSQGLSTFMVEMREAAEILKKATRRSLVILDEVGRGTSTYDGLAIAWSITEYLHDFLRAKTLFATHYHELTQLVATHRRAANVSVAVKEFNDTILFLHKLVEGATSRSYGVQVARLAGVPRPVIDRAKAILAGLESGNGEVTILRGRPTRGKTGLQSAPGLFDPPQPRQEVDPRFQQIQRTLDGLVLDTLTPIEAMNVLYQLKTQMKGESPGPKGRE
jgi:DNA mismatch repair protein MutS